MGSLTTNNYSWIDTAIVQGGNQWAVKWTNDTGESRNVTSISAKMGTGNGTYKQYDTGVTLTGYGRAINVRLKADYSGGSAYSDYQLISKVVGTSSWSGGITSTVKTEGKLTTWNFDDLVVPNGATVTFYFNSPDPSSGAVLCCNFDYLDDETIMPQQPATYVVKYDANGGSGAPSSQTKTNGVTLTLSSTKPTKSFKLTYDANGGSLPSGTTNPVAKNCTFVNWKDGDGTTYSPGGSYTKNKAATLTAQWTNPTVGTLPTPTRSGYKFLGWYTSAGGSTQVSSSTEITSNKTIYAKWIKQVTVSFDPNGGTGGPSDISGDAGSSITIPNTKPTNTAILTYNANGGTFNSTGTETKTKDVSLTFEGWARTRSSANAETVDYKIGDAVNTTESITLYAVWSEGAIGSLPTVGSGNTQIASRTGYRLDQDTPWTTSRNGSTEVTSETKIKSNTTIYAKWEYRVRLFANGGAFSGNMGDVPPDQVGQVTSETSWKKYGEAFSLYRVVIYLGATPAGWGTSTTAVAVAYPNTSSSKYTGNAPIDLYMIWNSDSYTVTFKTGYGDNIVIKTVRNVQYGSDVPSSQVPVYGSTVMSNGKVFRRDAPYSLVGWSGSLLNITCNTVLEALWDFSPIWIVVVEDGQKRWVPYKPIEE